MKTKTRFFFLALISALMFSNFTLFVVGATTTGYSTQKDIIASWLNAKTVGVNDKTAAVGTDQVTAEGYKFRVLTGGYRLFNTQDFGKITIGKDSDGNQIYGFYRRYYIDFDVYIRTLANRMDVVNPSVKQSSVTTEFAELHTRAMLWQPFQETRYYFTVPNYEMPDWRSYANRVYSAALKIKLEMNPSFEFPAAFNVSSGRYELAGMWAGIVFVKNPSTVAFSYGLIKDNVAIIDTLGSGTDKSTTLPEEKEGGEDITFGCSSVDLFFTKHGRVEPKPTYYDETEGSLVDYIYNTPGYEFDLYEITNKNFDFQFDPSITNKNYSAVWFPYNFRMRPETTITHSVWSYSWCKAFVNTGGGAGCGFEYTDPLYSDDKKVDTIVAWKAENPFQKQTLRASIDIISKYEFTPNIENGVPLEDGEEFVDQSVFGNIKTGDSEVGIEYTESGLGGLIDDFFQGLGIDLSQYGIYIYVAIGLLIGGVVLYFVIKRRARKAIAGSSK